MLAPSESQHRPSQRWARCEPSVIQDPSGNASNVSGFAMNRFSFHVVTVPRGEQDKERDQARDADDHADRTWCNPSTRAPSAAPAHDQNARAIAIAAGQAADREQPRPAARRSRRYGRGERASNTL